MGGSCDNSTAYQVPYAAATLLQQQTIYYYKDLKTMNVEAKNEEDLACPCLPAPQKEAKNIIAKLSYCQNVSLEHAVHNQCIVIIILSMDAILHFSS